VHNFVPILYRWLKDEADAKLELATARSQIELIDKLGISFLDNCPQEKEGYNCGVFIISCMLSIAEGALEAQFKHKLSDMTNLRVKIAACLLRGFVYRCKNMRYDFQHIIWYYMRIIFIFVFCNLDLVSRIKTSARALQ
jgi:Ulp1 protease family, C-terminal catalytic domain